MMAATGMLDCMQWMDWWWYLLIVDSFLRESTWNASFEECLAATRREQRDFSDITYDSDKKS
jgi:hypothetical protein